MTHTLQLKSCGTSLLSLIAVCGLATGISETAFGQSLSDDVQQAQSRGLRSDTSLLLSDGRHLVTDERGIHVVSSAGEERLSAEGRRFSSETQLPDGTVLIWGGLTAENKIASGAQFDPQTNRLRPAPLPLESRVGHSLNVLSDQSLVLAGGMSQTGPSRDLQRWSFLDASPISVAVPHLHFAEPGALQADGLVTFGAETTDRAAVAWDAFDPTTNRSLSAASVADGAEFAISASAPAAGSASARTDTVISIRFARRLLVTSLTPSSVTLMGPNGSADIRVVPAEEGRLLFVTPTRQLLPGSHYALYISGARGQDNRPSPLLALSFETASAASRTTLDSATSQQESSPSRGSTSTSAPPDSVTASQPMVYRAMAGTGSNSTQTACDSTHQINGYRFCHDEGSVTDGVFVPGFNNSDARWRLNKPEHPLLKASDLTAGQLSPGTTSVFGVVRRIDDAPLAHVTVSVASVSAETDADGRFVLNGVPSGHLTLLVDGATANHADETYGEFLAAVDVNAGEAKAMPYTLYMPRITSRDRVSIPSPTVAETVITHPAIPGLEIHLAAGTVLRDRAGNIVTQFAIVPMPVDRSPIPVPANFPVYFSVQPGTGTLEGLSASAATGMRVVYPNYLTRDPKGGQALWYYDASGAGWKIYSLAHPSDNGKTVRADSAFAGLHIMPQGGPSVGGADGANGGSCEGGGYKMDPVDCGTGTFVLNDVDLSINDVLPLGLKRGYNSSDTVQRPFGTGMSHQYAMYVYDPTSSCTDSVASQTLILVDEDGIQYPFNLVPNSGAGADSPNGYLIHTSTPSRFYGATMRVTWGNGDGFGQSFIVATLRDGTQYGFNVNCPSTLAFIADRFGNRINLTYSAGLLSLVTSPSGRYLQFSYNPNNLVSAVTDNSGRSIGYGYDSQLRLQTVTYPDTTTEQFTYTSNNQMQTVHDRRGTLHVTNTYDSNGRVHLQQNPDGTYQFDYTLSGSQVTATNITDPRGNVVHMVFDAAGYPTSRTNAYGTSIAETTTWVRGQNELVTSVTDALSRTTTTSYDSFGDILSRTFLYGTSSAVTYTATYTSDFHQLLTLKDPLSHTTTYGYTSGCLTSVKDALSHTTTMTCNASGQPLTIKDANNHTTTMTYVGTDLSSVKDALNNTTQIYTDELGRPVSVVDPLGREAPSVFDSNDRVVQSADALGQWTNLSYDGNGNLKSVTDPNTGKTQYGYDPQNRLNSRTDALNNSESWTYDGAGNLLTYTDRKHQLTQYQSDALNRFSLITFADSSTVTPTFDAANRLTSVVDTVSGTISRNYDGLDNLKQEQTPQGTVNYTYDAASRRATMTPASQTQIVYGFDNANRLTTITQGAQVVTIGYDNGNRRTSLTLPNGVVTSYGYDNADRLTTLTYKNSSGTTLASTTYGYDVASQRISRTGGFGSDLLPTPSAGTNTFNLNNQQTVWNGFTLGYDLNGDPTSSAATSPATTYTFDVRHRLTQITQGASAIASFQYDTFGRRTQKAISGTTTAFLYDGSNSVQETIGATNYSILTGLGIDERFVRNEAAGTRYFFTDALGSTVALTDSSQVVQASYSYEPFGEVTATGSSDNPYQYTGRENDGTGLYYYRARYYSPSLKRFISEDPEGLAAGLNSYSYASNNPTLLRDPSGRSPYDAWMFFQSLYWPKPSMPNLPPNGVLVCHQPADLPEPLNDFDHYWFKTENYESGMGGDCPNPGQGCIDWPYSSTVTKDHTGRSNQPGVTCEVEPIDAQCVDNHIKPGQPTGPFSPWNNCQTFSNSVIQQCTVGPSQ